MINKDSVQKIGVVSKSHGISGELIIRLSSGLTGAEIEPTWVFIDILGGLVPYKTNTVRYKNENELLVDLETLTCEENIRRIQGSDVYIEKGDLKITDNNLTNPIQLAGFKVLDSAYGPIGEIISIVEIKQNPLIEIQFNDKNILVPFRDEFIVSINGAERILIIKTPPGLIDLYLE